MKFTASFVTFACTFMINFAAQAQTSFSLGLGLGSMYSGLGANVAMVSEHDMKYLALGCLSYNTNTGLTCGGGLGWVKTGFIQSNSDKHGIGLYAGAVGTRSNYYQSEIVYGAGLGYYYFFNGIADAGTNLGLTLVTSGSDNGKGSAIMLQAGYQF